nr:MAG TPA: hypothetical protein [Caudoviricetes sp.]
MIRRLFGLPSRSGWQKERGRNKRKSCKKLAENLKKDIDMIYIL